MKILQIVTYISPDGAYGGPVRVAINQAKALTNLGHEVIVAAAAGGFEGPLPSVFDGFSVCLFPARKVVPKSGFAGLTSPGLLRWIAHAVNGADIIHVHLARDLVTLPAAALAILAGKPLVVQTHGMIDSSEKLLTIPLDKFLTKPVLKRAKWLLYLTENERIDLMQMVGRNHNLVHLPNGIGLNMEHATSHLGPRGKVPQVLFLARLHSRKRPNLFVESAIKMLDAGLKAEFRIVGPDEGELSAIRTLINNSGYKENIVYEGALAPEFIAARMRECDVYVLPSINEPFPMSVIEALAAGKPSVVTDSCGLSELIQSVDAGIVVDDSLSQLSEAIQCLVENGDLRLSMGQAAHKLAREKFNIAGVADRLVQLYIT